MECWCGNQDLLPFSPDYQVCNRCQTLVLSEIIIENTPVVPDDDSFYGKAYWFDHQQNDLGLDDILSRSRTDMPERVLYWLNTFLKYKIPPAKTLEIGCSHGGFVAMLRLASFQSSGLELSPWVVDFARKTFDIPMYLGPLEDQEIEPGTLDAIIMMDVLEHLPDPLTTIRTARQLLKEDGFLLIQTPCYPEGRSFESLQQENTPFLQMLKPPEHVFLFSQSSVRQLFQSFDLPIVSFEPAIFSQYDMFLVASQAPLPTHTPEEIAQSLLTSPGGRIVLALLDIDKSQSDQLKIIEQHGQRLGILEAEGNDLQYLLNEKISQLEACETDRAARLEVIHKQSSQYEELNARYAELSTRHENLLQAKFSMRVVPLEKRVRSLLKKSPGKLHHQDKK